MSALSRTRAAGEALAGFAAATAAASALYHVGSAVPFIAANLHALVAILFLYVPIAIGWRRGEGLEAEGLTHRPLGRSLALAAGYALLVLPLFGVGFVVLHGMACAPDHPGALELLAGPDRCRWFLGWAGLDHVHVPPELASTLVGQLLVVALPEELFFRGFILRRLELVWPPSRRIAGGGVGLALVVSAVLFALGHVLVDLNPARLVVFFPGLVFGWLRSATGSILAGTLAHTVSNLYIEVLGRTFFR